MATLKPRITISVDAHVHEVLRRLSAAGGGSMSSVVTDFLDVALPAMERMVVVLEQARSVHLEAKDSIRGSLDRAEAALLPTVTEAMDHLNLDLFVSEVIRSGAAERAGAEPSPGRPRSGLTPVPVTRGSGRPKGAHKAKKHGPL